MSKKGNFGKALPVVSEPLPMDAAQVSQLCPCPRMAGSARRNCSGTGEENCWDMQSFAIINFFEVKGPCSPQWESFPWLGC